MTLYVLDCETTGPDPWTDVPVSAALVRVAPGREPELVYSRRCNPGRPIPAEATAIHGITDVDVAQAMTWPALARVLHRALGDASALGAYAATFDVTILWRTWRELGLEVRPLPVLCGLVWARKLGAGKPKGEPGRFKLASVCEVLGIPLEDAHAADADALATARVLRVLRDRLPDEARRDLGRWTYRAGVASDVWFSGRNGEPPIAEEATAWARMFALTRSEASHAA